MNNIHSALDTIARRDMLENTDLWPQIAARIERKDTLNMDPRLKLAWTVVLVLLGLVLATTAAYAVYRYFSDPGMQSGSDAGLIQDTNPTAEPTALPTATAPEPATDLGLAQSLNDVTLSLDWVYLLDGRQALGFTAKGLAAGETPGMPEMHFGALVPEQYRGAGLVLAEKDGALAGRYIVYQIVREPATHSVSDTYADVSIDIPLLGADGQVLKVFHFDAAHTPVHLEVFTGMNTYASRANGLEMRLAWIRLAPQDVRARLCFDLPDGKDWRVGAVTIQLAASPMQASTAPKVTGEPGEPFSADGEARCQEVMFPAGATGSGMFHLTVGKLLTPNGDVYDGTWMLDWAELPDAIQIPGVDALEPPPGSEQVGEMTATLLKSYVDAN